MTKPPWQAVFFDPRTGRLDAVLYGQSRPDVDRKAATYMTLGFTHAAPVIGETAAKAKPTAAKPPKGT